MEKENSFDSLVSIMTREERQQMLEKMHEAAPVYESESFVPVEEPPEDGGVSLEEQLKKESLPFRIILWLKSIFTSTNQIVLFNEMKISEINRSLQRNYPGLVDSKKGLLLPLFYDKVAELKSAADFLRPYIAAIEKDEGGFYVFLGSIIMPEVDEDMSTNANPFSVPVSTNIKPELRVELIHNMDEIFQNIPVDSKQKMYEAVKSVEWLRQFSKIPFIKLLSSFTEVSSTVHTCAFSIIGNEFTSFAKLMSNGFLLSDSLLESLYLFSVRKSRRFSEDVSGDDRAAVNFMNNARSNSSVIHMFMSSVPMCSVTRVVFRSEERRVGKEVQEPVEEDFRLQVGFLGRRMQEGEPAPGLERKFRIGEIPSASVQALDFRFRFLIPLRAYDRLPLLVFRRKVSAVLRDCAQDRDD